MNSVLADQKFVRCRKGDPSGITVPAQHVAPQKAPRQ